ncbi:unnamed protein product [Prorocentrum cordatum]|uniref:Uncharacterized protein n=1 Tax=Prorocentrum cordatum TaxID=2364126 RepID=A0ABN9W006_9DINO|nr:unnamed protein product [Polarella glacialis]
MDEEDHSDFVGAESSCDGEGRPLTDDPRRREAREHSAQRAIVAEECVDDFSELLGREALHLEERELTELPEALGDFELLATLHLAGNRLVRLPSSLCRLGSLRTLSLADNRLEGLPENFGRGFPALETLDLHNNHSWSSRAASGCSQR